ncbi:MAG: DUF1376 domain-containing protein [Bradyrhizobium sp.]
MKRYWMPFYIADYLASTAHLTTLEHGGYLLLTCHYWIKGGPPESDEIARRVSRMTNRQWARSSAVLKSLFSEGWRHEGLDAELAKVIEKSTSASANARKSHDSRKRQSDDSLNTTKHHKQNNKDSDVGGRAQTVDLAEEPVSENVSEIVELFLRAAGVSDQSQVPSIWYNLRERAVLWIASGWPASMIIQETRIVAAKSETPKPIAYFEKVFATAFARVRQPLPTVNTPQAEIANVRKRPPGGQTVREALDAQIARAEDHDAGASVEIGQIPPRLLPPR